MPMYVLMNETGNGNGSVDQSVLFHKLSVPDQGVGVFFLFLFVVVVFLLLYVFFTNYCDGISAIVTLFSV